MIFLRLLEVSEGSERVVVYFVTNRGGSKWSDLERLVRDGVSVDEIQHRLRTGVDTWIIQTFLILKDQLRARGFDARFSRQFVPDALCIAHRDDLRVNAWLHRSYVVAVRADRPPVYACQKVIVQNRTLARETGAYYLPFWPQPGLIRREDARGARLSRLAYFGRSNYLPPEFLSDRFRDDLARRGVEFVVRDRGWNDYSDIDAVVAIRKEPPAVLRTKPASKLINAWHAGVPALLGSEPAYDEVRHGPLDYMEVSSPESVLAAVDCLQANPRLYGKMIQNGRIRAQEFSREAIAALWMEFIKKTAVASYRDWLRWNLKGRNPIRFSSILVRFALQGIANQLFGPRK